MNYLQGLEKFGIPPNFWCSEEYFEKAGLQQIQEGDILTVRGEEWDVFPSLDVTTGILVWKGAKIWSDFFPAWDREERDPAYEGKFLDYEYIYDPKMFTRMEGKKWEVFRKNHRKFPRRFTGQLTYDWAKNYPTDISPAHWYDLLIEWASKFDESVIIHDDEVMGKYLTEGDNKKALWDQEGRIHGINIWDENWCFINYRFCFCFKEDYLSEYMRWLFYSDKIILDNHKYVNDGGVLDSSQLKAFKDKLNPIRVREVKSWERRKI